MSLPDDPQLAAFRRLLADARLGGQSKVDAIVALSQRTVLVVPWPGGIEGYRTLVNSDGVAALPLFTSASELEVAATRYGWLDAHGAAPHVEIGARASFSYAISQNLSFVVVDIAAEHALELARGELEPLMTAAARRDSRGPYAGAGKISSSLIRAARPTPPPTQGLDGRLRPTPPPGSLAAARVPSIEPPGGSHSEASDAGFTSSTEFAPTASATFGGGTSVELSELTQEPPDALLDRLAALLRDYPEVEWACLVNASRGPGAAVPTVGVRVDPGFRQRVNEVVSQLRRTGEAQGAALDVLLLDDAELMRSARASGVVFYPWRKK